MNNTNRAAGGKNFLRLSFSFLFSGFVLLCWAAPAPAAGQTPSIGQILARTEANYRSINAFTAFFTQKTLSAAASTLGAQKAAGKLYYAKPRQMRWEYDKPHRQVFVANNQLAWLYSHDQNQITMFNAQKLFASPLASTFFGGALKLQDHFKVTRDPILSQPHTAVLMLTPLRPDPSIKQAYLWINLRTYLISRVETRDLLGNTNTITIDSFTPRPSLDPKLFRLQVPPAATVFDSNGRILTPGQIDKLKSEISSGK